MNEIATVVSVAGEEAYFEFAAVSIPSFLRNNRSTDLFVFTDNVEKIKRLGSLITERLYIVDLKKCFARQRDMVQRLETIGVPDSEMADRTKRYGFLHHHVFVSALLPMAEYFMQDEEKYTHILKIDIDSYFAGGDMMGLVRRDVSQCEDHDLFLVERKHKLMEAYGAPGVGFTLWRKGSNFISEYINRFHSTEQTTILDLYKKNKVKTKILKRPGHHFVRPFWKRDNLTKDMLEEFLPAYFHLHGIHARENMKKLEKWFNV